MSDLKHPEEKTKNPACHTPSRATLKIELMARHSGEPPSSATTVRSGFPGKPPRPFRRAPLE